MKISFKKVVPDPLKDKSFGSGSVWNSTFEIDCFQNNLLLSPSGMGKTTFVSFLFGSRKDYSGEVLIDGKPWTDISLNEKSELRKNKMSILPQDIRLFPELTTFENLQIKNRLTNRFTDQQINDFLSRVGLSEQMDQVASTLSQGQKQRVGIVRAMLQPFDFLILDEPFSHLDEENIALACELIREVCTENNAGFLLASLGPDYGLRIDQKLQL